MIFTALLVIAALGLLGHWLVPLIDDRYGINTTELVIGVVIMGFAFAVIINPVGTNMARNNSLKFQEFWNGYETEANHQTIPCDRDGPCSFEYSCDSYNHVHIETRTVSDGDGKSHTETYPVDHTHYHACPYATEEWIDTVETTLGHFQISHGFSDNPREWRAGSGIPSYQRGHTEFWLNAQARLAAHEPGPVTVKKTYDNYVLASQHSILNKYSSAIGRYQLVGLMPAPAKDIVNFYWAEKFYPLRLPVVARDPAWRFAVNGLNAALGSDLQGDLHLVMVPASRITDPDEYAQALFAYWQSPNLGRAAASKNTIIVVVGVAGGRVEWARADTGMPLGNEALLVDLRNQLKGVELTPDALIGKPVVGGPRLVHGNGAIEKALWGEHQFERVCMTCKDEKGKTGFQYLKGQIPLTGGQKTGIYAVTFLLSLVVWAVMCAVELRIPDVFTFELPQLRRRGQ